MICTLQRMNRVVLEPVSMLRTFLLGFTTFFAIGAIVWLSVITAQLETWNAANVKTINGVPPAQGLITENAGPGILITPNVGANSITIQSTGVLTVNSLAPDGAGDIVIASAGAGLGVASAGNTVTLSNTGVTSAVAGAGISVSAAVGAVTIGNTGVLSNTAGAGISISSPTGANTITNTGVRTLNSLAPTAGNVIVEGSVVNGLSQTTAGSTVTLHHDLTKNTQLSESDPVGPLVAYDVAIGFFVPIPTGVWRTNVFPAVVGYFPGLVGADNGEGNAITTWTVPAMMQTRVYTFHVDCEVIPSVPLAVNDFQSVSVALTLGATTEDPFFDGTIPPGAYVTMDLSSGTNAALAPPAHARRVSFSATIQAGCAGCSVQPGQVAAVHAFLDQTGVLPGPFTADVFCRMQVARIV
jgi:hypothetical protein